MPNEHSKKNAITASAGIFALVLIPAIVALSGEDMLPPATTSSVSTSGSVPAMAFTSQSSPMIAFKDGSYEAEGNYTYPGGSESITVQITLKDGVVTETSTDAPSDNLASEFYQKQFIKTYESKVVGKKITDIMLDRVAGSSLTTQGFNTALEAIKAQARA